MPRERSRERSPRERDRNRDARHAEDRDRERRDRPRDRSYRDRDHETRKERNDRTGRDRDRGREKDRRDERSHYRDGRNEDRDGSEATAEPTTPMVVDALEQGEGQKPLDLGADITPEEMQMMQAMGIPFGFNTTQGEHVDDDKANAGGVKVKQTRRARQYMNRRGGFNRALPAELSGQTALRD